MGELERQAWLKEHEVWQEKHGKAERVRVFALDPDGITWERCREAGSTIYRRPDALPPQNNESIEALLRAPIQLLGVGGTLYATGRAVKLELLLPSLRWHREELLEVLGEDGAVEEAS